jgi:hypothetical protein
MAHLINKTDLETVIDSLEGLTDSHKQHIKKRWLSYIVRWDNRAAECKWKHYTLRGMVVLGGVIIPALIGSAIMPTLLDLKDVQISIIHWASFGISLLVGISAALEEIFRFGEIWRDKRAAGELLNCEGWRYFQLVGKYKDKTHIDAYPDFAATVEDMIQHEIKDYLLITQSKDEATINRSNLFNSSFPAKGHCV